MLETMYVRCTHCGYDNSPEYRFCGMCGGSLARPATETRPPVRDVAPQPTISSSPASVANPRPTLRAEQVPPVSDDEKVHGPSFLGLSEDPKVEFNYLYEDEPARSHAGLIFVLLLLVGVGGGAVWQWRHNGFPFNRLNTSSAQTTPTPAPSLRYCPASCPAGPVRR